MTDGRRDHCKRTGQEQPNGGRPAANLYRRRFCARVDAGPRGPSRLRGAQKPADSRGTPPGARKNKSFFHRSDPQHPRMASYTGGNPGSASVSLAHQRNQADRLAVAMLHSWPNRHGSETLRAQRKVWVYQKDRTKRPDLSRSPLAVPRKPRPPSGVFFKRTPPCTELAKAREVENRSRQSTLRAIQPREEDS